MRALHEINMWAAQLYQVVQESLRFLGTEYWVNKIPNKDAVAFSKCNSVQILPTSETSQLARLSEL